MSHETLDKAIYDAVLESVQVHNQSQDLAKKILVWLEALHSGQESLEDKNAYLNRIDVLLEGTKIYGK